MDIITLSISAFSLAFICGFLTIFVLRKWIIYREVHDAKIEAKEIVQEAESIAEELQRESKSFSEEYSHQLESKYEKEFSSIQSQCDQQFRKNGETESRLQKNLNKTEFEFQKAENIFKNEKNRIEKKQIKFEKIKDQKVMLIENYKEKLIEKVEISKDEIKNQIAESIIQDEKRRSVKLVESIIENTHAESEKLARYYVNAALARFARPYCEERGIGLVHFPNVQSKERIIGPNRKNLIQIEKLCGVDISINDDYNSASCLGFDPVRRELARIILEKLLHEQNLSENRINTVFEQCKRELYKKIRIDGNRLSKELGIENLHPEIRNMMGALRYRYSFSQNQHFHCAEVGWLCGLLASEIGVDQKLARRAGVLHDIGKSMDHSMEGGHAVIGADFIEKHNESKEIVHAVRAHHFDEQPQTDLAFLVIAADALSGARPGARRSTVETYNQKMADLQKIGDSFDGVIGTYILSAGREVRAVVDSQKIDDLAALELSKKIANKIEQECAYPGQIRVTVVRESQAVDYAR